MSLSEALQRESGELRQIAIGAALSVEKQMRRGFRAEMTISHKKDRRDLVTEHDQAAEVVISDYIFSHAPDSRLVGEEGGKVGDGRIEWFVDPIDGTSNFADGLAFWCVSVAAAIDGEVVAAAILDPQASDLFSADLTGAWLKGRDGVERPLRSVGAESEADATLITGYPSASDIEAEGEVALHDFGRLVSALRQVRRTGSAALSLMHVAAGWVDAASGFNVSPWDVSAAELIVRQAGGSYTPIPVDQDGLTGPAHYFRGYVATAGGRTYPTVTAVARDISARRSPAAAAATQEDSTR